MNIVNALSYDSWTPAVAPEAAAAHTHALESGQLAFLPALSFALAEDERHLLSPRWSDGKAKNISFDPAAREVRHTSAQGADREALGRMMGRFADSSRQLVENLFPNYARAIRFGLTSYRPVEAQGRASSRKKDDTLIHVDAFASRPNQGERLLRVFSNINPEGKPREWVLGEPFDDLARRFLPTVPKYSAAAAWLLQKTGVTKGRRTLYDHYMLHLHDVGKLDAGYQRDCPKTAVSLPAGTSWIVYTDLVPHAVKSGQYALEQTFYLPVSAMQKPALSPLLTLESLLGRKLV
ncbi:MAG: Kdo hydroxylase family protein [Candidatus Methylumidiphilus sp.]